MKRSATRLTPTPYWIASFTMRTASHSRVTPCDAHTHRPLDENTNTVNVNHVDYGSGPCAASDRNPARDQIGTVRVIRSVSLRRIVGIRTSSGPVLAGPPRFGCIAGFGRRRYFVRAGDVSAG
jgi:hypothetical protein